MGRIGREEVLGQVAFLPQAGPFTGTKRPRRWLCVIARYSGAGDGS
jgi:hypothetical protein